MCMCLFIHIPIDLTWQITASSQVMRWTAVSLCAQVKLKRPVLGWQSAHRACKAIKGLFWSCCCWCQFFSTMIYRTCLFGKLHSFNLWWAQNLWSKRVPLPWWLEARLVWPVSVLFTTWLSCAARVDRHVSWEYFLTMHCLLFIASFQFTLWNKNLKK